MIDKHPCFSGIPRAFTPLFGFALVLWLAGCQFEAKQRPVLELDRTNPTANGSRYPVLASDGPDHVAMAWISSIEERVSTIEVANRIETQWYAPMPVHVGEDLGLDPSERPQLVTGIDGTRWIAWRELRNGGRLVLSRQAEGSTGWIHHRIPVPGEGMQQGVPRLARDQTRVIALWRESGEEESTLRLARWDAEASDDEMRLDSGANEGAWLAAGGPIRIEGDLLGEPAIALNGDSIAIAWIERVDNEIRLVTTTLPHTETESPPDPVAVGEWPGPGTEMGVHASLSMARQEGGALALTMAMEWGEERLSRLFIRSSESWSDRSPEFWSSQTGRTVIASGPQGGWILFWQQRGAPLSTLWLQRLDAGGNPRAGEPLGDPVRVGSVDSDPQSGHPAMMPLREEGIFLAWTQTDPFLRVRTALIPWSYEPDR